MLTPPVYDLVTLMRTFGVESSPRTIVFVSQDIESSFLKAQSLAADVDEFLRTRDEQVVSTTLVRSFGSLTLYSKKIDTE